MYVYNETYQSAYEIPSPIRKWFIERFNKQIEKENKRNTSPESDMSQPLSPQQKEALKRKYKK